MAGRLASVVTGRHRVGLLILVVAVVMAHGCVTSEIGRRLVSEADGPPPAPRMTVAFVREMALAAPPPAAALTVPPSRPRAVHKAVPIPSAASAPVAAEVTPPPIEPPASVLQAEPETATVAAAETPRSAEEAMASASAPEAASAAAASATAIASEPAAASAAAAPPFAWPAATRLTYGLKGYWRGELQGSAEVAWLHEGAHYQVHMDIVIGPSALPLMSRRSTSDGEITPSGLEPRRYDEDTKLLMGDPRRATVLLEPEAVVLPNGERRERPPGLQDQTSQFVQLSYLFGTRPELLRQGALIDIPVALPRRIERIVYEVREQAIVDTSFGALPTWHLVPRRIAPIVTANPGSASNSLAVEMWLAPELRYLPVRILIRQDESTYFDLLVARRPELAAP